MSGVAVRVRQLTKSYAKGGNTLHILRQLDIDLAPGDQVAIVGPSGCGKSTFLHILGMLDRRYRGEVRLGNVDIGLAPESLVDRLRNHSVGFVFQAHNLLPGHTALGNVMVPVRIAGAGRAVAYERAKAILDAVGLASRIRHRPGELSGGEQQRVAIARALVMGPGLILGDEPTGNLDPKTAGGVFDLFLELSAELGSTLIVVTHSHELAARLPRRLVLDDGRFRES